MTDNSAQLKDGRIAQIYYSNGFAECRAASLILRTYAELIDKGFNIEYSLSIFNSAEIIWAEFDNKPIGGICYFKQTGIITQNWILLSFTDPDWRGLNVNSICHYELEKLSLKNGIHYISSMVHIKNTSRIRSCEKVGMVGDFYRMSKKLK